MEITGLIKIINQRLKSYGRAPDGSPLWRLAWSDDAREWRRGLFRDFYGQVIIREVFETRFVKKYDFIKERWILERWLPVRADELPESHSGSFEPVFVFEDKQGNFLPPTLKVVEFIVGKYNSDLNSFNSDRRKLELENLAKAQEDDELKHFIDAIDISPVQNALHLHEGIGYTSALKELGNATEQ